MEKLGIEPRLLVAQIVNFAIIVVVLTKLLYKPVLGMLEKRKAEIEEGLKITERMRQEEENLKEREEKLVAEARKEARTILEDAKKQAEEVKRDIVSDAHTEATQIIEKAKREAQATHEALAGEIRREAVELAAAMAKRLLASILTPADQHALIDKHVSQLEKMKAV